MTNNKIQPTKNQYFITTPHLVWFLSRTPQDYTLWGVIKMVAGESGECFLSTADLAKAAMMSTGKVSDSRQYLIKSGLLAGELKRDLGYHNPVWHLSIPDIWEENIVWRKRNKSLLDRIAAKYNMTMLYRSKKWLRKCVNTIKGFTVDTVLKITPSQYEEPILSGEPSHNENTPPHNDGTPPHNETKKNPPITEEEQPPLSDSENSNNLEAKNNGDGGFPDNTNLALFTDLYTQHINITLSPLIIDEFVADYELRVQPEWIRGAIKAAVDGNARNWRYIRAIFDSTIERGYFQEKKEEPNKAGNKTPAEAAELKSRLAATVAKHGAN